MSMNTTYRWELKEEHYKGIDILQEHYGKKIASSNLPTKGNESYYKEIIKELQSIKDYAYYTTKQRIWLNDLRLSYMMDKKIDPSI